MSEKTELQKVGEETMRFMRGKYVLDEVAGKYYEIDCLKFRQGKKTILSINIHEDYYDFQIIFGKDEREKFEARRDEFPQYIVDLYDKAHTYHDGKWMLIQVDTMETLEAVKKMILIKKKPNRKPLPKENAIYSICGQRCDLCGHYTGISDEFRIDLCERYKRVYGSGDEWKKTCTGCHSDRENWEPCPLKKCVADKGVARCGDCVDYHSCMPEVSSRGTIEAKSISADDVTWAILPFAHEQFGN